MSIFKRFAYARWNNEKLMENLYGKSIIPDVLSFQKSLENLTRFHEGEIPPPPSDAASQSNLAVVVFCCCGLLIFQFVRFRLKINCQLLKGFIQPQKRKTTPQTTKFRHVAEVYKMTCSGRLERRWARNQFSIKIFADNF